MIGNRRLTLIAATALAAASLSACSSPGGTSAEDPAAQAWPEPGTTIEWIVPSAAGAGNDILARIIAPVMQEELGATIKVANVEGGSQVIGLTRLATSTPDGTTLGPTNLPSILGRYLDPSKNAAFARESFAPIGAFATNAIVIGVGANSPYQSIDELFDAAESEPLSITAGTDSRAGDDHINLRSLENQTGLEFNIVHYDSGADKVAAVLSGEIDFALGGVSSFYGPYQSGDIRLLAVIDDEPSALIPEIPTLNSAGYDTRPLESRFVVSVAAGTPEHIVASLETALRAATENPGVVDRLEGAATVASWLSAAEVAALWHEREEEIAPIIDELLVAP